MNNVINLLQLVLEDMGIEFSLNDLMDVGMRFVKLVYSDGDENVEFSENTKLTETENGCIRMFLVSLFIGACVFISSRIYHAVKFCVPISAVRNLLTGEDVEGADQISVYCQTNEPDHHVTKAKHDIDIECRKLTRGIQYKVGKCSGNGDFIVNKAVQSSRVRVCDAVTEKIFTNPSSKNTKFSHKDICTAANRKRRYLKLKRTQETKTDPVGLLTEEDNKNIQEIQNEIEQNKLKYEDLTFKKNELKKDVSNIEKMHNEYDDELQNVWLQWQISEKKLKTARDSPYNMYKNPLIAPPPSRQTILNKFGITEERVLGYEDVKGDGAESKHHLSSIGKLPASSGCETYASCPGGRNDINNWSNNSNSCLSEEEDDDEHGNVTQYSGRRGSWREVGECAGAGGRSRSDCEYPSITYEEKFGGEDESEAKLMWDRRQASVHFYGDDSRMKSKLELSPEHIISETNSRHNEIYNSDEMESIPRENENLISFSDDIPSVELRHNDSGALPPPHGHPPMSYVSSKSNARSRNSSSRKSNGRHESRRRVDVSKSTRIAGEGADNSSSQKQHYASSSPSTNQLDCKPTVRNVAEQDPWRNSALKPSIRRVHDDSARLDLSVEPNDPHSELLQGYLDSKLSYLTATREGCTSQDDNCNENNSNATSSCFEDGELVNQRYHSPSYLPVQRSQRLAHDSMDFDKLPDYGEYSRRQSRHSSIDKSKLTRISKNPDKEFNQIPRYPKSGSSSARQSHHQSEVDNVNSLNSPRSIRNKGSSRRDSNAPSSIDLSGELGTLSQEYFDASEISVLSKELSNEIEEGEIFEEDYDIVEGESGNIHSDGFEYKGTDV